MRFLTLVLILCLCVLPAPLAAGAWLRDKGAGFFSAGSSLQRDPGTGALKYDSSLYAEYGLLPRITVGFDYNDDLVQTGHAMVFIRFPLTRAGADHKFALDLGAGAHHWQYDWSPMAKATVSYGRAIKTGRGYGWLSVETTAERRFGAAEPALKLDMTLGLPVKPRLKVMLQLDNYFTQSSGLSSTLTPGLLFKSKGKKSYHLGLQLHSRKDPRVGLKLAVWHEF